LATREGGSEWEPIKILSQKNLAYIPIETPRVTHEQAEAHTNLSRYLRNKALRAEEVRRAEEKEEEIRWAALG
jgi:hypothetical protein